MIPPARTLPRPKGDHVTAPDSLHQMRRGPSGHPCGVPDRRGDGTTFLTIYLVLLFVVPARLVIGPLGGAGTPANIFGALGLVWWAWSAVVGVRSGTPMSRPIRRALVALVLAVGASYVMGTIRPISGTEVRSMESGLISLAAWSGVILVASDAIPNWARLQVLLRRSAFIGGLEASLGVAQFVTGVSIADQIQIPGLVSNTVALGVADRGGFARPAGTAIHSIEFGVSVTALLPVCLYIAMAPGPTGLLRRWFPVAATAMAIPLSVSRSAIIGAVVILLALIPTWSQTARRSAMVAVTAVVGAIFLLIPGFLGAFTKLFTGIDSDPSALSRTDSYSLALEFIGRSPWLGRGFMTFLPEYRILDNQYLGLLIDAGIVGLAALLLLFVTSVFTAVRVRTRSEDPTVRALCASLAAGVTSIALGYAFFDAFSFPMASGVSFLLVGLISGVHRLQQTEHRPPSRRGSKRSPAQPL